MKHKYSLRARPGTHAHGFSLVELMVALTVGLIITAAVVQIFVTSSSSYSLTEGYTRAQESGRFGIEFMSYDIRMAGYMGCRSNLTNSDVNNITDPQDDATFFPEGFRGFSYTGSGDAVGDWTPARPVLGTTTGSVQIRPLPGSDIILSQYAGLSVQLDAEKATNANVQISNATALAGYLTANDVLIVADCEKADIFRATTVSNGSGKTTIAHANSGNTDNFLQKAYGTDAELLKLVKNVYFIARRGNDAANPPSLYRASLNGSVYASEELVTGVEMMRILYGYDASGDGSASQYLTAAQVDALGPDWNNVVAIRIGFVVNTGENNIDAAPDTNSYNLLGQANDSYDDYGPVNDQKRRRVFTTTIRPRNP